MDNLYFYDTPIGRVGITANEEVVTGVFFGEPDEQCGYKIHETPLIKETAAQLKEYFAGTRKSFRVPLEMAGTAFQKAVWDALLKIPYGKTASYGDIAKAIGKPMASRAVGGACHMNPIPLLVPCHRVVGSDGSLTGFGGGLSVKEFLLNLEKSS